MGFWAPRFLALLAAGLLAANSATAVAAGVVHRNPWWFRDGYRQATFVDPLRTTAALDTWDGGTVRLPYAPLQLALDPRGTYALLALPQGVSGYVFDGRRVRAVRRWDLGALPARGVSWIDRGRAFALNTGTRLVVYGLAAGVAVRAGEVQVAGAGDLAPGPRALPLALLAADASGATLYRAVGTTLQAVPGGPAGLTSNLGVAATPGGGVVATWQAGAIQIWVWDGGSYLRARGWDPPAQAPGAASVVGVAFFPGGGGYWVLTADGRLNAYAIGTASLQPVAGLSRHLAADPAGLAAGWGGDAVAVLYPTGWLYEQAQTGGGLVTDVPRSLSTSPWPVYAASAVLVSRTLAVGHSVGEVRIEPARCSGRPDPTDCTDTPRLPPGTAMAYALSTDGGRHWTAVPAAQVVTVPPGDRVLYRLSLHTADATTTPVVRVTNIYELARRARVGAGAAVLCAGGGC